MSSSKAALDERGAHPQEQTFREGQVGLAFGVQLESLKGLALELTDLVARMEESRPRDSRFPLRLSEEVRLFEKGLIENALKLTGGNQTRAARLLGVKLTTLHTKIRKYRIPTERPDSSPAGASLRGGEADDAAAVAMQDLPDAGEVRREPLRRRRPAEEHVKLSCAPK
jgi:hypothetical protein